MAGLRLCRDCRYPKRGFFGSLPDYTKCTHPEVSPAFVDKVTGSTIPKLNYCDGARSHGPCGAEGKLWAPKGAA